MEKTVILAILKPIVMILFFLIVIIVGNLPIKSKSFKRRPVLRAFGGTFAGALFINVALLHILPESAEAMNDWLQDGRDVQVFPLAYLFMMIGFLITVFFTKVLVQHRHEDEQDLDESRENNKSLMEGENLSPSQQTNTYNFKEAYILTIAMYFHTLFEGIAIGVQSSIGGFLSTAVAIGFHKWADALSMGCHYRNKNVTPKIGFWLIAGQAILNILAIGIGWLISAESNAVVEAIFLSISAGTFLAISTLQLLTHQLNSHQFIKRKYLMMVVATAFVSGIWFVENSIFTE